MKNTNIEPYWDLVSRVVKESDIVLEVLDSRLIEFSRNKELESLIKDYKKNVIFVVNKSDLVSKKKLKKEIKKLKKEGEVVFVSKKNKKSFKILLLAIKKIFKKYGKSEIPEELLGKARLAKADIVVSVVGYPNVGKSSIINFLAHRKKTKVSKKAGTTHGIHWIKVTNEIKLIDTPGVVPLKNEDEIKIALIGAKNIEKLKEPLKVSNFIIRYFLEKNKKELERLYGINITSEEIKNKDSESVIKKIAEKKRFLIKGGELDENRASFLIIKDWQDGKLRV